MHTFLSLVIGYLLGSLSPSALIGKIKNIDLRSNGTRNLGASNTLILVGRSYGAFVMIFDVLKSYVSVKIAQALFPTFSFAGILAGGASIVGHIFPFYLRFKGGKGLASFGGMILGLDPGLFVLLLVISGTFMLLTNYGVAMPMSAGVLFPLAYGFRRGDIILFFIAMCISVLVIIKHWSDLGKALRKENMSIREIIKK